MNLWECNYPGCKSTAVGVGGAIGLQAIGWYFEEGPTLFCPHHIPNPIVPCMEDEAFHLCPQCTARELAQKLQGLIELNNVKGKVMTNEKLLTWFIDLTDRMDIEYGEKTTFGEQAREEIIKLIKNRKEENVRRSNKKTTG